MQWQPWLLTFVLTLLLAAEPLRGDVAKGKRGVIATVHPLATEAGLNAFRAGGNAVDAAIAAALTLGVVDGHNSGIGGGCFMVLHLADGRTIAVDGREKAPAKATREMFIRAGKAQTELSQRGPLAVGTPGAMAAYAHAVEKYGKKPLAELITPAARIAETGFALDRIYAQRLAAKAEEIRKFPETRRILLTPDGKPLKEGEVLKQPDLARTYHAIASRGVEWRGPLGRRFRLVSSQRA